MISIGIVLLLVACVELTAASWLPGAALASGSGLAAWNRGTPMVSLRNLPRQDSSGRKRPSRGSVNEQRATHGFPP
jgi:hypothetical protein